MIPIPLLLRKLLMQLMQLILLILLMLLILRILLILDSRGAYARIIIAARMRTPGMVQASGVDAHGCGDAPAR